MQGVYRSSMVRCKECIMEMGEGPSSIEMAVRIRSAAL